MLTHWISRGAGVFAVVAATGWWMAPPASAAPVADYAELRSAVSDLNGTGPSAEIELKPGTVYTVGTDGCADEDDNAAGDLDVRRTQPLKIFTPDGQAPAILASACDPATSPQRILHVMPAEAGEAGTLTLRNVVIRNGHAPSSVGGGVLSTGSLVAQNTRFENNKAHAGAPGTQASIDGADGGAGGAVAASGSVVIEASAFTGNQAGDGGPGFSQSDGPDCTGTHGGSGGAGGQGGAILAMGGLTITNSTFSGNRAGAGGQGGRGGCGPADAAAGNGGDGGAGGNGGAVQCGLLTRTGPQACSGPAVIKGSTLSANSSGDGGGGNGGNAAAGQNGGMGGHGGAFEITSLGAAIMFVGASGTSLTVENSTLDANVAGAGGSGGNGGKGGAATTGVPAGQGGDAGDGGNGGAGAAIGAGFAGNISDQTVARLTHVTATGNGGGEAGEPGEPGESGQPADTTGSPSTITTGQPGSPADTTGQPGSPTGTAGSSSTITAGSSSTITAGSPSAKAAGQPGSPTGTAGSSSTITAGSSSTITAGSPSAKAAGQPGEPGESGGAGIAILNTWTSTATVVAGEGASCAKPAQTATFSLSTDDSCGFGAGSTTTSAALALGPLADNGGPTQTRLPGAGSALLDKVTTTTLAVDQRGITRPQNAAGDIGAVEVQAATTPPPGGQLPITGPSQPGTIGLGVGLVAAGALLLLATRRRRTA